MKVFFDGGCRPNPGVMELAVVAAGQTHVLRDVGHGTNTDAEWLALLHALHIARALGVHHVTLLGDAAHVIRQATGVVRCSSGSVGHLTRFRVLAAEVPALRIRYTKRSQNLAGIALARLHPR